MSESRQMRAVLDGVTVAESDETIVVEGTHYFPPDSISWEHMRSRKLRSLCPWKGIASYYDVETPSGADKAAAWTYKHPFPWIRKIRDHIAFWGRIEVTE